MSDYKRMLLSPVFGFRVGVDKVHLNVHSGPLADISEPIRAMMTSGMKEQQDGYAEWPDVELDVFTGLYEFACTGAYNAPEWPSERSRVIIQDFLENHTSSVHENAISHRTIQVSENDDSAQTPPPPVEEAPKDVEPNVWDPWSTLPAKKRKTKTPASTLWFQDDHEAGSDRFQPGACWARFRDLHDTLPPIHAQKSTPHPNLLFHAKLYLLAEEKLIEPLRVLCWRQLHADLSNCTLRRDTKLEVLSLVCLVYLHTGRMYVGGKDDLLREMVIRYAASKAHLLRTQEEFRQILDVSGEIGSDLIFAMIS